MVTNKRLEVEMATLKAYANGATMGTGNPAPVGGPRGEIVGWTTGAVRRHKGWLYSIDYQGLTGHGDGVTLTLRDIPPSEVEWRVLLDKLFRAFREMGLVRWHWVVEWQLRGAPHLHMAVYLPPNDAEEGPGWEVVALWRRIADQYGPGSQAQFVSPITGPAGWDQYLSKHAARGVKHYQRQGKPPGWKKTGKLWGYGGSWPTNPPTEATLSIAQSHAFRRMVRSWAIADARATLMRHQVNGDPKKIRAARRSLVHCRGMLRCNSRGQSTVRGISNWVPAAVTLRMAEHAGWEGEMPARESSRERSIMLPRVQRSG